MFKEHSMDRYKGQYALVQFSPVPERFEFVNIGVMLIVPELNFIDVKFADGQRRVDKVFGKQSQFYLNSLKSSFESRLGFEFSRSVDSEGIVKFAEKRANEIRLSPLLPVMVKQPKVSLDEIFEDLVFDKPIAKKSASVRSLLKKEFSKSKVSKFLDKPEPIEIPQYELKISVPFGYQNGRYNLIDGMRMPENQDDGLREAGKMAFEGDVIWNHFEQSKKLIVVGDFSKKTDGFYNVVKKQLNKSNVDVFRLDDMRPLLNQIQQNSMPV
jgi:hypothetical protein